MHKLVACPKNGITLSPSQPLNMVYAKGLVALALTLDDAVLKEKARR